MRRPVVASAVAEPFQVPSSGALVVGDRELAFNEWRIPYSSVRSAVLQTYYAFGFPRYHLLITDGKANYLFHIPAKEAVVGFPFPVQLAGQQSRWRRFWWVALVALWLLIKVYK
jgi:hypothetical protein